MIHANMFAVNKNTDNKKVKVIVEVKINCCKMCLE